MSRPAPQLCFSDLPVAMRSFERATHRSVSLRDQLSIFSQLDPDQLPSGKTTIDGRMLLAIVLAFSDAYRETVRDLLCVSSRALVCNSFLYPFRVPRTLTALTVEPREHLPARFIGPDGRPTLPTLHPARVLFEDVCVLFPALVKLASVAFEGRVYHLPLMRKPLDDILHILFVLDVLLTAPPVAEGTFGICRRDCGQIVYCQTLEQELSGLCLSLGVPRPPTPPTPRTESPGDSNLVFFGVMEPLCLVADAVGGGMRRLPDELCDLEMIIATRDHEDVQQENRDWIVAFPLGDGTILADTGDFVDRVRCVRWRLFGSYILMHLSQAINDSQALHWPVDAHAWLVDERLAHSPQILEFF